MQEHACEHCDSCCNVAPGTIGDANGGRSAFKVHFWKFLSASGLLLAISILIEFSLLPVGGELADLVLAQGLAVASVVLSCHDVFLAALSEIKGRRLGASTLMVVAAVGSFLILHAQEGAMAIWLYSVAEKLEDVSSDRARDAVSKLMELAPDVALLKAGGEVRQVPTRAVKVGDVIVVKPGMKVALDGKVVAGESYFDTHTITGESVPRLRSTGDVVFASSINGDSLVELEVTKASGDTLLDRITDSIRAAQRNKSRTEVFIQRFARYYTPLIFLASISLMVVPWLAFQQEPLPWVYRALILLVISCPCALTLSTPLSMVAALTKLSREGVLVKGGRYIEELDKVGMFGFDKTATLTEGKLKLHDVVPGSGALDPSRLLHLVASLEANSQHPIAKAIVNGIKGAPLSQVVDFSEVKGKGVKGRIGGVEYHAGSVSYINGLGIDVPKGLIDEYAAVGKTPVLLAGGGEYVGLVTIRDNLRVSAPVLLRGLRNRGIKSMIISGDVQSTVDSIGDCLHVDERYGNLLPGEKLERIKQVQGRGVRVCMVGDGINDAPALTQANVGIAMGSSGADVALEAADVTIMNDDLTKILVLLDIKRIANRIVRQNIWLSIAIKVSFAILTVLGFMNLAIAVGIGDMGVSLLVIFNGFRVLGYRSKFQDITADDLEVEATKIICKTCMTASVYPQHHGREMVPRDGHLVCWKSLVAEVAADACKERLSLACPTCSGMREVV